MITSKELFETELSHACSIVSTLRVTVYEADGTEKINFPLRYKLVLDYLSGVKYLAVYIVNPREVGPLLLISNEHLEEMLNPTGGDLNVNLESSVINTAFEFSYPEPPLNLKILEPGSLPLEGFELPFSGRMILYTEFDLDENVQKTLNTELGKKGLKMHYRGESYKNSHGVGAPAFISHASIDKDEIARPIASGLRNRRQNVWYDEYSLTPGDSLRESIESGLKNCRFCILVLTPNFLSKGGWVKREYDSIFTREIVEDQKLIIPVWHGVSVEDVYQYSPILADRVGINWDKGVDLVCNDILKGLMRGLD